MEERVMKRLFVVFAVVSIFFCGGCKENELEKTEYGRAILTANVLVVPVRGGQCVWQECILSVNPSGSCERDVELVLVEGNVWKIEEKKKCYSINRKIHGTDSRLVHDLTLGLRTGGCRITCDLKEPGCSMMDKPNVRVKFPI